MQIQIITECAPTITLGPIRAPYIIDVPAPMKTLSIISIQPIFSGTAPSFLISEISFNTV